MVICCVDLRDGRNQRVWLIFIPCAYYIKFESKFPYHFIPMKACNNNLYGKSPGHYCKVVK